MADINVQIEQKTFNVTVDPKPQLVVSVESKPENALNLVVETVKVSQEGTPGTIQTKIYPLSGLSSTIQNTTHGFTDLLNYYVVNEDLVTVEVVFLLNNNNIQVLSNVSLNNHLIIIKGYN